MKTHSAILLALMAGTSPAWATGVDQSVYGTTEKGETVHVFTLKNDHGMSARILDYGGTIAEINVPGRDGKLRNVVMGLPDLKSWETQGSQMNCIVGRVANQLKHGFTLDGHHYALPEGPSGTTLHSGPNYYGQRIFAATTAHDANGASVTLHLLSPDGDQGFPGTLNLDVTYTLTNDNSLRLDYKATTDKPTIVNFTNHTYFTMAGTGSGSVENELLQVMADQYTPTTDDKIPTGARVPVAGTAMDFRRPMAIGARIRSSEPQMVSSIGYNINMVLRHAKPGSLDMAARLTDPVSGTTLELSTTEPGVQLYSANNLNGHIVNAAGTTIRQTDAMALETEHWPDSANHPDFPSTVLRPGQVFTSTTVMHIVTR